MDAQEHVIRLLFISPERFQSMNNPVLDNLREEGFDTRLRTVCITEECAAIATELQQSQWQPHVILINEYDYGWDGTVLIKLLRQMPEFEHVPIVAISTNSTFPWSDRLAGAKQAGANEAIELPYNVPAMHQMLRRLAAA